MSKYKIHIDKPLPEPSQIARHKDFDRLYGQYQVATRFEFWRNLPRNPGFMASVIVVFMVGLLVFQAAEEERTAAFIQPPVPPKNIPFQVEPFVPEGAESFVFSHPSGSEIHVPEQAFIDAEGNPVTGEVELRYREFRDGAEIFIGGIPMSYDSAGTQYDLTSAGMLEILAFQNGEPVYLKSDKQIEVVYFTSQLSRTYSVYHLDTLQRNWVYRGKDEIRLLATVNTPAPPRPQLESVTDLEEDVLISKSAAAPQRPGRPFGVRVKNPQDHPEFRRYEKVYWEHVPMPGFADPWAENLMDDTWGAVSVKAYRMPGVYELTFARANSTGDVLVRKVIARPMFEAQSQGAANRIYQARLASYEQALAEWQAARDQRQRLADAQAQAEREYAARLQEWELATQQADTVAEPRGFRRFVIDRLGVVQLARIQDQQPVPHTIHLKDESGQDLGKKLQAAKRPVYVLCEDGMTLLRCAEAEGEAGRYVIRLLPNQAWRLLTSDETEKVWYHVPSAGSALGNELIIRPLPGPYADTENLIQKLTGEIFPF